MVAMTEERPRESFTGDATFANSAAANTVVNLDIPEIYLERTRDATVTVYNPSTVTALTVKVQNVETLGGAARYATQETITVPVSSSTTTVVENWLLGEGGRLAVSNDTVLGIADGFTASVRVRIPQG